MDAPRATSGRVDAGAVDGPEPATGRETTMKAIVQDRYGGPEVLELRDIDRPAPKDGEVLVRLQAAGLHRGDWHVMTGLPYLIRLVVPTLGLRKPREETSGHGTMRHQPCWRPSGIDRP